MTGKPLSAAQIEHNVSSKIRGGDVILLHDGAHDQLGADRSQTLTATDHLLTRYKKEEFEFLTIPQMMDSNRQSPGCGRAHSSRVLRG